MKRSAAIVALAATGLAARRYLSMRDAVAEVATEFRSPVLPFVWVPFTSLTLPLIRRALRVSTPPGPDVTVAQREIGSMKVLVVSPSAAPPGDGLRPGLLWLHGGGMITGSPQVETAMLGRLTREVQTVVVAPDYRLAPEHPFPAPLDDCMAALHWMRDNAADLGIDIERIAVGGASAGGGLAAAIAQRCHDEGIALRAQVLTYPMLDDRTALRSEHHGRGRFGWTPQDNVYGWTSYLGREPRLSEAPEYAAPARRTDLGGLPAAWVGVGGLDLFHEEAVAYAERLRAAGVPCELVTVPGMYHAAEGFYPDAETTLRFRGSLYEHLRTHLH